MSGQRFAIVADGADANVVDALGASPVAFADHFPILLVNGSVGTLSAAQLALLKGAHVADVLIVGGTAAVGAQVAAKLEANGQTPFVVAGSDRSGTSRALAEFAIDNLGFSTTSFDLASGDPAHLIDSLAGGPYGALQSPPAPTLITDDATSPASVTAFAAQHAGTEVGATVFGGTSSVSAAAQAVITTAAQTPQPLTAGSVHLLSTAVSSKGIVSGVLTTPALVASLSVSGCGLTSAVVLFDSQTGDFSISPLFSSGTPSCTLTFAAALIAGGTVISTAPVKPSSTKGAPGGAAPVLIGANIVSDNLLSAANSEVAFTFSQAVIPKTLADFELKGVNSSRPAATPSAINADPANNAVIDAEFPPTVDVASYLTATADKKSGPASSAVVGAYGASNGLVNPKTTVPLGGSSGPTSTTVGPTTAPDLVSAALDPSNNEQVTYTFDKPVEVALATDFGAYAAAGVANCSLSNSL